MADSVEAKFSELGVRDPEAEGGEAGSEHEARSDSQGHDSSSSALPKDQKLIVKFLMSNAAAGAIIGKGGASIAELQDNSGARLQLSRAAEFFPGTADRVMLIAGTLNAVLAALHLVLLKVQSEQVGYHTPPEIAGAWHTLNGFGWEPLLHLLYPCLHPIAKLARRVSALVDVPPACCYLVTIHALPDREIRYGTLHAGARVARAVVVVAGRVCKCCISWAWTCFKVSAA